VSLRRAIEAGDFAVTCEIGPPKGTDVHEMLETAEYLKDRVHAMNVTDNQSAVMRLSSLGGCALLKARGIDPVLQMTCRDRNRLGLQSDLLAASAPGVDSVLALTGDFTTAGDHPQARPVFDVESVGLLGIIQGLNEGHDMVDGELEGATELFPGAIVTPEADPIEPQKRKFEQKVAAGARFIQTQAVYDIENFKRFMEYARGFDVKVMAGILLLTSAGMAKYLNRAVPGVEVPADLIEEMSASDEGLKTGVEIAARLIEGMRPHCDGVHVMAVNAERSVVDVLDAAGIRVEHGAGGDGA
jgi:5,10-methylenetetrahydrofolate reductase